MLRLTQLVQCWSHVGREGGTGGASPWNSPMFSALFKCVTHAALLTKDGLSCYPAPPPGTVMGIWHTSNTDRHDAKSIQTAMLNKSASRSDRSMKHKLTTQVGVPLGRKVDNLTHIDPMKSLSSDDYFLRDSMADQKKFTPCCLAGRADVTIRQRNSLQNSHRMGSKASSLCAGFNRKSL